MIRDPIRYLLLALLLLAIDAGVKDVPVTINDPLLRALLDSGGHAVTALLCWLMVRCCKGIPLMDRLMMMEACVTGILSSAVDVDHFIEASSWRLSDATSLHHRPFFHCSTLMMIMIIIMLAVSLIFRIGSLHTLSFMCATAWTTHHLRDALRRGLWFCPFGSTSRLQYDLYLVILLILPFAVSQLMDLTSLLLITGRSRNTLTDHVMIKRKHSAESEKLLTIMMTGGGDDDIV